MAHKIKNLRHKSSRSSSIQWHCDFFERENSHIFRKKNFCASYTQEQHSYDLLEFFKDFLEVVAKEKISSLAEIISSSFFPAFRLFERFKNQTSLKMKNKFLKESTWDLKKNARFGILMLFLFLLTKKIILFTKIFRSFLNDISWRMEPEKRNKNERVEKIGFLERIFLHQNGRLFFHLWFFCVFSFSGRKNLVKSEDFFFFQCQCTENSIYCKQSNMSKKSFTLCLWELFVTPILYLK